MSIKDDTNSNRLKIDVARMTGTIQAYRFILKVEQNQRRRLLRRIFKLCTENAELGGSEYKRVLKDYKVNPESESGVDGS